MPERGAEVVRIRTRPSLPIIVVVPRLRCDPQLRGVLGALADACRPATVWWEVTRRFGAAVQAELERFVADHRHDRDRQPRRDHR